MWTKVKKNTAARPARSEFGVRRDRSGTQQAKLLIPGSAMRSGTAEIYSDGNGKLAFLIADKGSRKIAATGKSGVLSIPLNLSHLIPFGTRDAVLTADGDMLVLDTAQFKAAEPAQFRAA